ncbi:MAG: hypothetical protein WCV58_02820 [Patescibacteria group bacterium]
MLSLFLAQSSGSPFVAPTVTVNPEISSSSLLELMLGSIPILIFALAVYVYMAMAVMTIANKTGTPNGWLAWIPIANVYLLTQIAQVSWLTMLVYLLAWIPIVGSLAVIAVTLWWWWRISEQREFPGWIGLLMIIPIANFIIPGILAWSNRSAQIE